MNVKLVVIDCRTLRYLSKFCTLFETPNKCFVVSLLVNNGSMISIITNDDNFMVFDNLSTGSFIRCKFGS